VNPPTGVRNRRVLADLRPLKVAPYRRLWTAWTVASLGQQMAAVAVAIQIYGITESSLSVGLVGLFQFVPLALLGLYGGALSDRFDRRIISMIAAIGLASCASVLLAQAVLDLRSVTVLYIVVAAQSSFFAIGNPARQAAIPRLIGIEQLPAANALSMLGFNFALTVGPLVGGGIIAATSQVAYVYALDVVAFFGVIYAVRRLPSLPPLRADGTAPTGRVGLTSVVEGLKFLRGRRNLQMSFYLDIVAMVLGMPRALFPALAAAWYASDALAYSTIVGLLSAAPAIGSLLAGTLSGLLLRIHRHGLAVFIAVLVWGAAITGFGLVRSLPLAVLFLAVAGGADTVSAVFRSTILQTATPDEYRGRLQGVFTVVVAGGPRLGDVESGVVAEVWGEWFSVISGGIGCIILAVALVAFSPKFLKYDSRNPTP
jgi:MFS family permease